MVCTPAAWTHCPPGMKERIQTVWLPLACWVVLSLPLVSLSNYCPIFEFFCMNYFTKRMHLPLVPGFVLFLLQDHYRGSLFPDWPPHGHEWSADRVPPGHQHSEEIQPLSRGNVDLAARSHDLQHGSMTHLRVGILLLLSDFMIVKKQTQVPITGHIRALFFFLLLLFLQ